MGHSLRVCLHSFRMSAIKLVRKINSVAKPLTSRNQKELNKRQRAASGFSWLLNSSSATMELTNQFKQVFNFMDANGDGKISPLELSAVLLSLGRKMSEAEAEAEAQGMVREMDCNGDGYVDLEEFMKVVGTAADNDGNCDGDGGLMEAFLVFDSDRNGLISAEELRGVLIGLGCGGCSMKECHRMIQGVDKDGDGFVNFEEFKAMMAS